MRIALTIEPHQGISYADQLAVVLRAEIGGLESVFRSDHFGSFPAAAGHASTDAWTTVAGMARETTRIGLGVLVSPVTFRHPGQLSKVVTTADEMSNGRIEVGLGTGWNALEHHQLGIPFPSFARRVDLLEDQLAILHGLWTEPDGWDYSGHRIHIRDARFHPKPAVLPRRSTTSAFEGSRPRIILGGGSTRRSAELAATYADEVNVFGMSPTGASTAFDRVTEACRSIGRAEDSITRSVMVPVLIGEDRADVRRREEALAQWAGAAETRQPWFAERRSDWVFGTVSETMPALRRWEEAGVQRVVLQDFLPWDLEMVDLICEAFVR